MRGAGPVIEAHDLVVGYGSTVALGPLTLRLDAGAFVVVIGPSGAGKTTLLRAITGFVRPARGRLRVRGVDVARAGSPTLRALRKEVATVHQAYHLVERASALDNVLIGRLAAVPRWRSLLGWFPPQDVTMAYTALLELGLGERARRRVDTLSGGERQRVAVARALVQRPSVVLADEPAASLDQSLTEQVLTTLEALNREHRVTVVVNLHDLDLARRFAQRLIALRAGRLVFDGPPDQLGRDVVEEVYRGATSRAAVTRQPEPVSVDPAEALT